MSERVEQDDFAKKFQLALEALNWSRSRCARELGVDKSVISRWASGGAHPTGHNLTRFTAMLQQGHPSFQAGDWRLDATSFEALLRGRPAESDHVPPRRGPIIGGPPSVAVLAFENLSGDAADNSLADGIPEDIVTELSRSRAFLVVSRSSSFTYRGRAANVKQIASELGARYVLEGSVRHERSRIRVTSQLIDAESGTHIWADRHDCERQGTFAIQDEITRAVTTAVCSAIADAEMQRAMYRAPSTLGPWELYQQGMWHLAKLETAENDVACVLFRRAVEFSPVFGAAHIGLAYGYSWAGGLFLQTPVEQARQHASMHARKAVELDPGDADALAALAWTEMFYGKMDNVLWFARQALSANPYCVRAHATLGMGLIFNGRTAEGREQIAIFARLSPRDPSIRIARRQIVVSHYFDGDYNQCIDIARHLLGADPELPLNYRWMAAALGQLGRVEEAQAALATSLAVSPREYDVYVRNRIPWMRREDYDHMLDGLRKAGWNEAAAL